MCGLPPYTADRLIDVVGRRRRGTIRLAEYFERPLRLTPAEGSALLAAGRALLAVPGSDPTARSRRARQARDALGASGGLAVDVGEPVITSSALAGAVAATSRSSSTTTRSRTTR